MCPEIEKKTVKGIYHHDITIEMECCSPCDLPRSPANSELELGVVAEIGASQPETTTTTVADGYTQKNKDVQTGLGTRDVFATTPQTAIKSREIEHRFLCGAREERYAQNLRGRRAGRCGI